jgi:hypothetical protein
MPLGKLKDMRQMREINPALLVAERGERGQERSVEGNTHLRLTFHEWEIFKNTGN